MKRKRSSSPSADIHFYHWMTVFMHSSRQLHICHDHRYIVACSAMASPGCQKSRATSLKRRSSKAIQSATSISTLQKCKRPRASFICMLQSTEPRSLPSCSWSKRPIVSRLQPSSSILSQPSLTKSTLFSRTTASSSPFRRVMPMAQLRGT